MKRYRLDQNGGLRDAPNGWLVKHEDAVAEIERLEAVIEQLEADAARYAFIRDNQVQAQSPQMDGTSAWHVRRMYGRTGTFGELVDRKIQEAEEWQVKQEVFHGAPDD